MRSLLLVALALAACTHTRPISTLHQLAGQTVTVEMTSQEKVDVVVESAPDGIAYRSASGYVPANLVARVVDDDHRGRGGLEGLGIGFLSGAVVGGVLGYADGDDECSDEGWCILTFTAGEKAVLGGVLLGGLGGILGGIIGLAVGSRDVYSYGEQIRVMPTGPPGSVGGMTITF